MLKFPYEKINLSFQKKKKSETNKEILMQISLRKAVETARKISLFHLILQGDVAQTFSFTPTCLH